MTGVIEILVVGMAALIAFGFWEVHRTIGYKKPDETKLNSTFEAIQAKEKAANDANIVRIDTEDRLHLLDDINRKPRV